MTALLSALLPLVVLISKSSAADVVCEAGAIDLVFLIDDSGSIATSDYQLALEAAVAFSDALSIGDFIPTSRVGLVIFDGSARLGFRLDAYTTNAAVDAAILASSYTGDGTNIANGMSYALTEVFDYDESQHGKRNAPRILVLMTDGGDDTNVAAQHAIAASKGIVTYAIGIGSGVSMDQLTAATGDRNNVYTASDFSALKTIINQVCHKVEASLAPPVPPHAAGSCGCELETLDDARFWLDIIFVIDSSDGCSTKDFESIKNFLMMMSLLNMDHAASDPQYSRMAIVNTATDADVFLNLNSGMTGAQIQSYVKKSLIKKSGYLFDVQQGLKKAEDLIIEEQQAKRRQNVPKAVVIFSTTAIECDKQKFRAAANESNVLCELVSRMKGEGTALIGVPMRLAGEGDPPYIDIVSPCNLLENTDNLEVDLLLALCRVNCFCLDPYTQFVVGDDGCDKYSECLYVESLALPYHSAKATCEDQGNTLPTIFSLEKDDFLKDFHLNAAFYPYWIGLTCTTDQCTVADETPLSPKDYTNWCKDKSQPNLATGECVYEDKCHAFDMGWISEKCGNFYPAHYFSCQTGACSVSHYCEYDVTQTKVSTQKVARRKHRRQSL